MRRGIVRIGFVVTLVGIVLFALGGAAIAAPPDDLGNVGQNGPSVPKLGDPVATQSEVQWITISVTGASPSGTYRLVTDGPNNVGNGAGVTQDIAFNAPATGAKPVAVPDSLSLALVGQTANATANPPQPAVAGVYPGGSLTVVGGPTSNNYDASGNLTGTWYYRVTWSGTASPVNRAQMTTTATGSLSNVSVQVQTYEEGATIGTARVQPHGGYNATTDYCLQCHSVHDGADYALLASTSVTATCQTCHSLFGDAPKGAINPGIPGKTIAPASMRAAYEVTNDLKAQHQLGSTGIPFSTVATITESGWSYGGFSTTKWAHDEPAGRGTASDVSGGLYCGDCHTPHGDFGQLINSKYYRSTAPAGAPSDLSQVYDFKELGAIYFNRAVNYLHLDGSPANVWEACPATNKSQVAADSSGNTLPIAPTAGDINAVANGPDTVTQIAGSTNLTEKCSYLTTSDSEGEGAYLYGYKLLSAYPNHSWDQKPVSWNLDANNHDSALYCARCHDKALPSEYGGTYHNHPTGCTACHGNPNDATSSDFPHTSTFVKFLKDYPDLLCINCHTAGSLP